MKKNYIFTLLLTLCFNALSFGQVFITELADPSNESGARYVEIYNAGNASVDLTNWSLKRYTNGNSDLSTNVVDLSSIGSLASGAFALIAANETTFQTTYGVTADISAGTGGPADSNGDDQIVLFDATDAAIDIFGVPGEDGSGTCHEFEDGRAERKASATVAKTVWDEADWSVWADSTVSGCTSHTNSARSAPEDFDPGAWIGTATSPIVSVGSAVSGLDYFEGNGPSLEKTFSVEGVNLTANVAVSAPVDFEISLTSDGTFTNAVTLTQTGGTLASTPVYVRLKAGLGVNTYAGDATTSSAGTDTKTVALSGEISAADSQFSVTAFLDDFNYVISDAVPSAEQTFTVEGLFLTNNLVITAPTNYEVSLVTGSAFSASVTIAPSSGAVAETTIYARLKAGLTAGNYTGNIIVSSSGVADATIEVNGNAFGAVTNSMVITGVYDGSLSGGTPKGVSIFVLKD